VESELTEHFDPYHRWLGIPPKHQPPDYYRLLSIERFEDDLEVITNAAERRIAHVRRYQLGPHSRLSQRILNQLAAARACLLDPNTKAEYDLQLREEVTAEARQDRPAAQALPNRSPQSGTAARSSMDPANVRQPPVTSKVRSCGSTDLRQAGLPAWLASRAGATGAVAGGCVLAVLLVWLVCVLRPEASDPHIVRPGDSGPQPAPPSAGNGPRPAPSLTEDASTEPPLAVAPFDEAQARAHQKAWADHVGLDAEITNSIGMRLVLIPPGEFMMGSPQSEEARKEDEYQHRVRITKPFYLGVTEVTQEQWEAVMETRPWSGSERVKKGEDYATTNVSWEDAQAFCERLTNREGTTYRLPTEAEWEYACRAGTTTAYHFGDDGSHLGEYAWFRDNAYGVDDQHAHRVAQKKPNAFGLYDMHGNVWEWCSDRYADYPAESPVDDPMGPESGSHRVYRGGCWYITAKSCRSADRSRISPDFRYDYLSFRVARSPFRQKN